MLFRKTQRSRGQSLVEYVALTALVAIVSIGTVKVFGSKVRSRLNQITNTFDRNVQQGLKGRPSRTAEDDDDIDAAPPMRLPGGLKLPGGIRIPGL